MNRSEEVAADTKEILHDAVDRREAQLRGRLEAPHLTFTLARRLMRDFHSVVLVLPRAVHHGRHHGPAVAP